MNMIKKCISIMLTAIIVFGMFSGLITSSAASALTYTYKEYNCENGLTYQSPNIKTENVKTYKELSETISADKATAGDNYKPWFYLGAEVYEKNKDGDYVLTDHYFQGGEDVRIKIYLKGNFYSSNFKFGFFLSKAMFDIGLDDDAESVEYSNGTGGFSYNQNNPLGKLEANQTLFVKAPILTSSILKTKSSGISATDLGNLVGIVASADIPTSTPDYASIMTDEYLFSVDVKVKDNPTITNGYMFFEEYGLRLYGDSHKKNAQMTFSHSATAASTKQTSDAAWTTGKNFTRDDFITNDMNHVFVVGNPPSSNKKASFTTTHGTAPSDIEQTGTSIKLPKSVTGATGYTLIGWTSDSGTTVIEPDATVTLTADTTYAAVWGGTATFKVDGTEKGKSVKKIGETFDVPTEYASYTWNPTSLVCAGDQEYIGTAPAGNPVASFTTDKGTKPDDIEQTETSITLPNITGVTGYDLKWSDGTNQYDPGATVTLAGNTTFTAVWTAHEYNFTWTVKYPGGTTYMTSATGSKKAYGTEISKFSELKVGTNDTLTYSANDWTLKSATALDEGNKMPAADVELEMTLSWIEYDVTFVVDGTSKPADKAHYGDNIKSIADAKALPTNPTGYTYSAWAYETKAIGDSDTITGAVTLYTSKTANKYTVTYYVDGQVYETVNDVAYGTAFTAIKRTKNDPEKAAGTTAEWVYTDLSGTTIGGTTMPDYAVKATWKVSKNQVALAVTLKLEKLDGNFEDKVISGVKAEAGETVTVASIQKVAAEIPTGFVLREEGSNVTVTVNGNGTSSAVLYFTREIHKVNVVVGETVKSYTEYKYGAASNTPADVTTGLPTGMDFVDYTYYKNENCTELYGTDGKSLPATITFDIWAKANFTEHTYQIKKVIEKDGSKDTSKYQEVKYNATIPTITYDTYTGYEFSGWYIDNTYAQGKEYGGVGNTMGAGDVTVYGKYTKKSYTIKYYYQLGDAQKQFIADVTGYYNDPIVDADRPTGDTIKGYKQNGQSVSTFNKVFDGTITEVIFKYTLAEYNVYFYKDEAKKDLFKSTKVLHGNTVDEKEIGTPEKVGYSFKSWTPEISAVNGADQTYVATWNTLSYTAKFIIDEETPYHITAEMPYGTEFNLSEVYKLGEPEKDGQIFDGWTKDGKTYTKDATFVMGANDVYTINWKRDTSGSQIASIENKAYTDRTYYDAGVARYKVTFKAGYHCCCLYIIDQYDNTQCFSLPTFLSTDPHNSADSGIYAYGQDSGFEFWEIELVLPEGTYKAYCMDDEGVVEKEEAWNEFEVKYNEKPQGEINADVVSVEVNPVDQTKVTETAEGKAAIKLGEKLSWTIVTDPSVYYIKLATNYDGSENGYTYLFKKTTTGVDGFSCVEGSRTIGGKDTDVLVWTIPATYSFNSTDVQSLQHTVVKYRFTGSTVWFTYQKNSEDFVEDVLVVKDLGSVKKAETQPGQTSYDPYTIIAAPEIEGLTAQGGTYYLEPGYQNVIVKTTDDVTRVRVKWTQNDTSKNATYQENSKYNVTVTDNKDGTKTWVIKFKFIEDVETYSLECRGPAWGSATTLNAVASAN